MAAGYFNQTDATVKWTLQTLPQEEKKRQNVTTYCELVRIKSTLFLQITEQNDLLISRLHSLTGGFLPNHSLSTTTTTNFIENQLKNN